MRRSLKRQILRRREYLAATDAGSCASQTGKVCSSSRRQAMGGTRRLVGIYVGIELEMRAVAIRLLTDLPLWMRSAFRLLLVAAAAIQVGWGEQVKQQVHSLALPSAQFEIVVHQSGKSPWVLCNLHDDENTSVRAGLQLIERHAGRLVEIRHSGERNCSFQIGDARYVFDPNRIFTPVGIRQTLSDLSQWDEPAQQAVASFAESVLAYYDLDSCRVVIALHNNTDGRYSAVNYLPTHDLAADAAAVAIDRGRDTDDFFFVTDRRLFEALKQARMNVVLQDNQRVTDDGSLSVYCGQRGIPYVNVEAQHEHGEQQVNMLETLWKIIEDPSGGLLHPPLVNLASLQAGFVIDARYATTQNITGRRLYPANELYLAPEAAARLVRVQQKLKAQGMGLKLFDAYRPLSVQQRLWDQMPDERYVANPAKGSRHNRGYAVDVTLVDDKGQELPMPTAFDEFSKKAHLDYQDLPAEVLKNRATLQEVMRGEQFEPLATEWWHFDAPGWQQQPVMDVNPYGQPLFP